MDILENKLILQHNFTLYKGNNDILIDSTQIAKILENKNVSQMLKNIDEDEKILIREGSTSKWYLTEDGLYEVLMLSKKEIAKKFKKEVKKILKEIREKGGYLDINKNDTKKSMHDKLIKILEASKVRLQKELDEKNKKLIEYNEFFKEDKETVTLTFLAEKYQIKQNELFEKLNKAKFIYKKGNNIYLYREHKYKQYVKYYKKKNKHIIKFTSKGQLFIDNLLKMELQ